MIYEYLCDRCNLAKDVIRPVSEYNATENCTACNNPMRKIFSKTQLYGLNDKAEYNYSLGMVVKNKQHMKQIAKERGLIEVGTESPETIKKYAQKTKEERYNKSWGEV